MQIILYSKHSSNPEEPVNSGIGSSQITKIPDVCTSKGNVCVISQTSFRTVSKIFAKILLTDLKVD